MNENQRPHFWIPDEEVEQVSKKLTSRTTPRDIVFSEHGAKLSQGLQMVKQAVDTAQDDDSLRDVGLYVFKVEFPQGEKVQHKSELFSKNGMHLQPDSNSRHLKTVLVHTLLTEQIEHILTILKAFRHTLEQKKIPMNYGKKFILLSLQKQWIFSSCLFRICSRKNMSRQSVR